MWKKENLRRVVVNGFLVFSIYDKILGIVIIRGVLATNVVEKLKAGKVKLDIGL